MSEFKIANISDKEKEAIKKAEQYIKQETGKDIVLIAWQSNNIK